MNRHLTPEQIAEQVIGGGPPLESRHVRDCAACGSEVARIEGALLDFRGAMHNWADSIAAPHLETSIVHLDFRRNLFARNRTKAGLGSLALHAAALASALALSSLQPVRVMVNSHVIPLLAPVLPKPARQHSGGGGGGARQPEVKKAELPKTAPRVFTPPRVDRAEVKLELPAAVLDVPDAGAVSIGDVTGLIALNGSGYPGGIGTGIGNGIGPGKDPGVGTGNDGGAGGRVYNPGGDVTKPIPISMPEPEYSEEARRAKWMDTVTLSLIIDENGHTTSIHVTKPVGLGLDEKAIAAVAKWLFKPATKGGKPVKSYAEAQVVFRLL